MATCSYKECPGLKDRLIICSLCKNLEFHSNCATRAKCYISHEDTGIVIYCRICQANMLEMSANASRILNSTYLDAVNEPFLNITDKQSPSMEHLSKLIESNINNGFSKLFDNIKDTIRDVVREEIKGVVNEVKHLKTQIQDVITRVEQLETAPSTSIRTEPQLVTNLAPAIASEVRDINNKLNNAILYGVPELSSQSIKNSCTNETDLLIQILSKIPDFNPVIKNPTRLGKPSSSKPRPIRVTFNSRSDVFTLIKSCDKLPGVTVSTDKTKSQRAYLSSLIKTKNDYNSTHPLDKVVIKYRDDVPYLVDIAGKTRCNINPSNFL